MSPIRWAEECAAGLEFLNMISSDDAELRTVLEDDYATIMEAFENMARKTTVSQDTAPAPRLGLGQVVPPPRPRAPPEILPPIHMRFDGPVRQTGLESRATSDAEPPAKRRKMELDTTSVVALDYE